VRRAFAGDVREFELNVYGERARPDDERSPNRRLMTTESGSRLRGPFGPGGTNSPASRSE